MRGGCQRLATSSRVIRSFWRESSFRISSRIVSMRSRRRAKSSSRLLFAHVPKRTAITIGSAVERKDCSIGLFTRQVCAEAV